jgi:hypothetical protein
VATPEPEVHRITGADAPASEVHRITDAGIPLSQDQAGRQQAYAVAMTIRTACFLGAVLAPSPWRWILAAGAVTLPYFAVVVANAGRERSDREGFTVLGIRPHRRAVGRGQ